MTDYHVHIGQYNKTYFYPDRVIEALAKNGVDECTISSTTSCIFCREFHPEHEGNPSARKIEDAVTSEIGCAVKTGIELGVKVNPLYWVVPEFEKSFVRFEDYFSSKAEFSYSGFKIHPMAQSWDLSDSETFSLAERVFAFASEKSLSILIHTGIDEETSPVKFENFIKKFQNARIQLAHCKNMEEMNYMLNAYGNVFADNSTSLNVAARGKILFGSDFPALHEFSSDPETSELILLYKNMRQNEK